MNATLKIETLGAQGDGVAETPDGPVFVPFTLPGELVTTERVGNRTRLVSVDEPSPDRVTPPCRHFTVCGGCSLQHMADLPYQAWKRDKVEQALAHRGLSLQISELVPVPTHSRRRAVFSARRSDAGMAFGYHRAQSHDIVDIVECPIALPEIEAAIPMLRVLAGMVSSTRDAFHLMATWTQTGLDVAASGGGPLAEGARRRVSEFIMDGKVSRLSIDGETVVEPRQPLIDFGGTIVMPPAGGFLQAVAAAESAMAQIAVGHLRKARRVADLFSGAGAFSLRLARASEVHAVESDAASLAALDRGYRFGTGLKRVTTERRDLERRPVTFKELAAFDGVLFDPPRAGAEEQSTQIARSDVPYVVAVSCNPATLARDLRILVDGGYRLKSVTPIDQFLWSPHVEAVALLEKPKRRR